MNQRVANFFKLALVSNAAQGPTQQHGLLSAVSFPRPAMLTHRVLLHALFWDIQWASSREIVTKLVSLEVCLLRGVREYPGH